MKFITRQPLWANILIGILLIIILVAVFILSLRSITQHGESMKVPSVVGENFTDARAMLEAMGFEVVVQDSVYQTKLPPLAIIKQIPDADATVKVNRTVYLTINRSEPPMVEMPNLLGYSYRNAEMVLKNMGLLIGDTSFKPDFAKNSILEQHFNGTAIHPGTQIRMGSSVSLILGDGVGNIEMIVPSLIGMTYADAERLLRANGLSLGAVVLDPGITDTLSAFIYKQNPERLRDDGIKLKIRPGQLMDVWLSSERPVINSEGDANQLEL
ncbi:MAG: PASTA domain-containing protein [Chitinophagaceae bacterium]|nr:PASTA domain-containing protein [Chitinophagaceae bacterium]